MRYKDFHHSKKVETPLGSKLECIFCHKTGVRLYLSEDGKGICRECVKLGALSF